MAEGSTVDYLVEHREIILKAYRELGPKAARDKLITILPGLEGTVQTTFNQYVRLMAALVTTLNATHDTQPALDAQADTQDGSVTQIATQPGNDTQKIHNLESDLTEATQLIHKLQGENADLRNRLATQKLHMAAVTQDDTHVPDVTQFDTRGKPDTQLIHMEVTTQDTQKMPVTITGWSVQFSGGYYRAHRRVAGKMKSIYLGKFFDHNSAKEKIQTYLIKHGLGKD